ncbi:MAG TPA: hypothetical protein VH500_14905 [Nitrososphaeraceae archaeon]
MKSARLFALSTLLAVIITVPAIVLTLLLHYIIKLNIMTTMIIGIVVFIATMGVGFKISKRLMSGDKNTIDL